MLTLLRDGFIRDLILLIIVSITLGAAGSYGVAAAVDNYFGETVNELIGEFGEYDVIIHIREEAQDAADRELEMLIEEGLPGSSFKKGLVIAGQANYFLALAPELRQRGILENLGAFFGGLPGYNGFTFLIEPTITINNVHKGVQNQVWQEVEQIPGVDFVFRHNRNLMVLLKSIDDFNQVNSAIEEVLSKYQILDVRLPLGYEGTDMESLSGQVTDILQRELKPKLLRDVSRAGQGEDTQAFLKALGEMRRFLLSYAAKVQIELTGEEALWVGDTLVLLPEGETPQLGQELTDPLVVEVMEVNGRQAQGVIVAGQLEDEIGMEGMGYRFLNGSQVGPKVGQVTIHNERYLLAHTIDESLKLLGELDQLAAEASNAVEGAERTLNTFHQALYKLEELQLQMQALTQNLQPALEGSNDSSQVFLSLLLNSLFKDMLGEGNDVGTIGDLDVALMRDNLDNMALRLDAVRAVDLDAVIGQMEQLQEILPELEEAEIGQSVRLINSYMDGQVIPGERIELLVDGAISGRRAEQLIREGTANEYLSVVHVPAGTVSPNPRAELFRVLVEVRGIIAGLIALVFTLLTLILDHATIFSAAKYLLAGKRRGLGKLLHPVLPLGALLGAILFIPIYRFSGADIPWFNSGFVALIGAGLGLITVALAEKLSPVDSNEIIAGEALGLTYADIMREIVLPAGRPGLLNVLSRLQRKFS
ncbi:MAG: ABC transporter permease [Limnochordia bacterium]|jgi:hypothetical protein